MSLAARRLDVSENGLDGTIPTYVGDLSDLLYVLTVARNARVVVVDNFETDYGGVLMLARRCRQ